MKKLRKIIITTNGLATARILKQAFPIIDDCNKRNVAITLCVSLDGVGELHDKIRGVKGHFRNTMKTVGQLRRLQEDKVFRLTFGTTISKFNADHLVEISDFSRMCGLRVAYYLAWASEYYYNNTEDQNQFLVSSDQIPVVIRFLNKMIIDGPFLTGHSYYYEKAIGLLKESKRSFPCLYSDQGIVLDGYGNVRYCNNSNNIGDALAKGPTRIYYDPKNLVYRKNISNQVCPHCSSECLTGIAIQKRLFPFLKHIYSYKLPLRLANSAVDSGVNDCG
jgi:sulfatase maturation enzyme AslB (radical SAM superfamily)